VDNGPRATPLVLVVLQWALTTALPLADARAESKVELGVHVEPGSSAPCAAGHDALACAFCRAQLAPYQGVGRLAQVLRPAAETCGCAPRISGAPSGPLTTLLRARAPPAARQTLPAQDIRRST
jgi:hypothetical protein